jgi:TPP-dependent pyruvate/acetoin dehydrogenase alpha subunit
MSVVSSLAILSSSEKMMEAILADARNQTGRRMFAHPMPAAQLLDTYHLMLLSRRFDERCTKLLHEGKLVPHFHSGVGQEALMVAPVMPLRPTDQMIYTHRGYGHLLAKGISLKEVALDMFMKVGGTNHGLGGVMHVSRPDLGVPGREGVFGSRFGIAVGFALAAKLRKTSDVVACFYGEAAGSRGILYEALNMAVLWSLPLILLAENNGWSFTSRTEWLYPKGRMSRVWRGFDIPVEVIDGNDVDAIFSSMTVAIERARAGKGPSVIEGLTYRLDPHIWYDDGHYQPPDEIAGWRERDPLALAAARLRELGCSEREFQDIEVGVQAEVEQVFQAVAEARDASWEDARELVPR